MEEIPFDPELTKEQEDIVALLSTDTIEKIDEALLAACGKNYRKVAMVVAIAMSELKDTAQGVPDIYYSQCVARLAAEGKLLSQGNLRRMRYSEVKLA